MSFLHISLCYVVFITVSHDIFSKHLRLLLSCLMFFFLIIIDLSKLLHFCLIITLDIIDINMSPEKGPF